MHSLDPSARTGNWRSHCPSSPPTTSAHDLCGCYRFLSHSWSAHPHMEDWSATFNPSKQYCLLAECQGNPKSLTQTPSIQPRQVDPRACVRDVIGQYYVDVLVMLNKARPIPGREFNQRNLISEWPNGSNRQTDDCKSTAPARPLTIPTHLAHGLPSYPSRICAAYLLPPPHPTTSTSIPTTRPSRD